MSKKINVIIPLCGKGSRFSKTHEKIKPLIKVGDKEIIMHLLDSLYEYNTNQDFEIYIIINKNTNESGIQKLVQSKYPTINIVDIINETEGAATTVLIGLNQLNDKIRENESILILDGDSFYTVNIIELFGKCSNNAISYFNDSDQLAQYSYIRINEKNHVMEIKEKEKISDNANSGGYYFMNTNQFKDYVKEIMKNKIMYKNEYYISTVIGTMIKSNKNIIFEGISINKENHISLGTPELVTKYLSKL